VSGKLVRAASSAPREYFGQQLVDHGICSSAAAASAFWSQQATHVMVGAQLPKQGVLDEELVRQALLRQIRENLLDCYRWEHGDARFVPGEPAPSGGVEVAIDLLDVHRDALQRAKEWREFRATFPSEACPLIPAADVDPGALPPDEQVLLDLAQEGGTVRDALDAFRDGDYQVYRRLMSLAQKDLLMAGEVPTGERGPSAHELLRRAAEVLQAGDVARAAELATKAATLAPSRQALSLLRDVHAALTSHLADTVLSNPGAPFVRLGARKLKTMDLQSAERYLLMRGQKTRDLRETVREAPMGELEALRILQRLIQAQVLGFCEGEPKDELLAE